MPAFVKTKQDEERWSRAKQIARDEGRAEDWSYVTGIYKRMSGGKVAGLHLAYGKEFLDWASGRKFRNPKTRKDVKFDSLPPDEKKKVHSMWSRGKKQKAERDTHTPEKVEKDLLEFAKNTDGKVPDSLIGTPYVRPHGEMVDGKRTVKYHLTDEGEELVSRKSKTSARRVASRWLGRLSAS